MSAVGIEQQDEMQKAVGENVPKIKFEQTTIDLKAINPNSTNLCEFKFTNAGSALLKIKKIIKTCGCTPFKLDKKEFKPGETGTIKVEYHAGPSAGKSIKHLYVSSNDPCEPKVELIIKSQIVPKVKCIPSELKLRLKEKNAGCVPIVLKSTDGQPFAIKSFSSPRNVITVPFDPNQKADTFTFEPKVDISKLEYNLKGQIRIDLTHPDCKSVYVNYEALSEYQLSPSSIVLFNTEPGKKVTRQVWILSNYNEKFEIESVKSQNETMAVKKMQSYPTKYKLDLEITPPPIKGEVKHNYRDTLNIKIKGGKELTLSCNGFYKRK
ncbi:MAG: DUF1573 domain-containing protein [Planctomycetes bacterium]|nr:DUF1573 domain-containing protein [Planctomycetota bacterium]